MSAIYLDIEQGTEDWCDARRGIVTASNIHHLITPTGRAATGEKPATYLAELIAERIETGSRFYGYWMERGHELEAHAISAYHFITGRSVKNGGLVFKDEQLTIACSPDGLVGKHGGIEIKSLKLHNHIKVLLSGEIPKEHVIQCHANLWVTGRKWWDFIAYHPSTKTQIIRLHRDDNVMAVMDEVIPSFVEDLAKKSTDILEYDYQVALPNLAKAA